MTGDPIADALVALLLGAAEDLARTLDPAAREAKARDAVEAQLARFHAADPGPLRTRMDALEQKRRDELAAHAAVVRSELAAGMMLPAPVHAAVVALADHAAP